MIQSIPSPFQTPAAAGTLCVILDASFDLDLPSRVEQAIGYDIERCVPLLEGTRYAALQGAGPFALMCPRSGAFTDYAANLLEQASAGFVAYLKDEHAFDQAVEHWRSLLTVSTDDAPTQMMRFFEPRWLEPLLSCLDKREVLQFIGPLTFIAWRNELGWRGLAHPQPELHVEVQAPGWLHIGHERQQLLERQRLQVLAARFAQGYETVLAMPEPTAFVYRQLLAARQAGYLQVAEQERWLRLVLRKGEDFSRQAAYADVLARDDLGLGDKLLELERL